eukprot:s1998_g11.t2
MHATDATSVQMRPRSYFQSRVHKPTAIEALDFMERWFQGEEDTCFAKAEGGLQRLPPRVRQELRMFFNIAIKEAGNSANITKSVEWYERMRAAKIVPNARTFGKLIASAAKAGLVDEAASWLEAMEDEGLEAGMVPYCSMITACAKDCHAPAKDIPRAERWFQQASQSGLKPDLMMYGPIIDGWAALGNGDEAAKWLSQAEAEGIELNMILYNALSSASGNSPDLASYNTIINFFAEKGDENAAKEWLHQISSFGLKPDSVSYNSLIKAAVVAGHMDHTKDYLEEMESHKLHPSALTYGTLVSAYADSGDVQNAQRWYDKALAGRGKSNTVLLAVLLKAYVKVGDLAGAENCIKKAAEAEVVPNHVVFTTMINAYAESGDVDSALAWFRKAKEERNIRLNIWSYNAMIKACAKAGDVQRAQTWFKMAENDRCRPDVVTFTSMISACSKAGRVGEARRWLERLENAGVQPNVVSYTVAISAGAQSKTNKSPGLREYQIFQRMLEQGIWPNVLTYNYLLQSMIRSQPKMERQAEDVFRHMMQCGIKSNELTQIHLARVVGLQKARSLFNEFNIKISPQLRER